MPEEKKSLPSGGVVVGKTDEGKILTHDGPEHVLLIGQNKSDRVGNTVIPTALTWKDSAFFLDYNGEIWHLTSGYRKNVMKQRVLKFDPVCKDGSANRWNPLAEINFRTDEEIRDVYAIVSVMVKPDGEKKDGGDPFLDNCASNLLSGVIMHLMYKHYKENLPLPSPTDIVGFLSWLDKDTDKRFGDMMTYQHISPDEFLEREHPAIKLDYLGNPCKNPDGSPAFIEKLDEKGQPMKDKQGQPVYEKECYTNPLREIYGDYYVRDLKKINDTLTYLINNALKRKKPEELNNLIQLHPEMIAKGNMVFSYKSMARTISEIRDNIRWAIDVIGVEDDNTLTASDYNKICWAVRDDENMPFHRLLTHPRVVEQAAVMKNGAEQTRASIIQKTQTVLGVYGDPVVQKNMCVSDFCIRDFLNPRQGISCYCVMQVKDIAKVKPIASLFVSTILNKLLMHIKWKVWKDTGQKKSKKQRLLLMLDEFPKLGNMQAVELAQAICADFGIKMCIVCRDVKQLDKVYMNDNVIAANCHVHIYFTSNLDTGGATSEAISNILSKRTIKSISCMSQEEAMVCVAGQKPIKCGKLRYHLEPHFTKRILDSPKCSDQVTRIETYGELFRMNKRNVTHE